MFRNTTFFWAFGLFMLLLAACSTPNKPDPARAAQAKIDSTEKALLATLDAASKAAGGYKQADNELENVLNLIKSYQLFTVDFPKDTATPTYLLKEAQLFYNYLHDFEQAEKVFAQVVDSFPEAKNRPSALFFMANSQQDRGDTAAAQATLLKLMREHPGTGAAKLAPQMREYMRNGLPKQPQTPPTP